jgi:DNA repair protein RadA/Sms
VAKIKSTYVCQNCGAQSPKWIGKCNSCGEWNTYSEEIIIERKPSSPLQAKGNSVPLMLSEIDLDHQARIVTGNEEFDRVIGGGLVPGGLILLGGEPGIGKSTLVLQRVCNN